MPENTKVRVKVPPVVAAVVRPVSARLSRIEDLLIEMRHEQDLQLKKISKLHERVDLLTETLAALAAKALRR